MTSFKEFLAGILDGQGINWSYKSEIKTISVKKLGDWAWKRILPELKKGLFEHNEFELESYIDHIFLDWFCDEQEPEFVYWEIVVACLGEKEVKKRLEDLK